MSGGEFNYKQYTILAIRDDIERIIASKEEWHQYSPSVIVKFKEAVKALDVAYTYARRVDYLVSSDDGEDSFHERLKEELEALGE